MSKNLKKAEKVAAATCLAASKMLHPQRTGAFITKCAVKGHMHSEMGLFRMIAEVCLSFCHFGLARRTLQHHTGLNQRQLVSSAPHLSCLQALGWVKKNAKIIVVGLDNSGKSTIINFLKPKKVRHELRDAAS